MKPSMSSGMKLISQTTSYFIPELMDGFNVVILFIIEDR
jgi:hypothetical protein